MLCLQIAICPWHRTGFSGFYGRLTDVAGLNPYCGSAQHYLILRNKIIDQKYQEHRPRLRHYLAILVRLHPAAG